MIVCDCHMNKNLKISVTMKRILIPGLMLVAALALTNCAEQLETPLQENDIVVEETMGALSEDCVPYDVFVESAETKTNNQDGRTLWIKDVDEIALFHKKTDGYQYHSKFVYAGFGAFRGNLVNSETLADKNDWYAIYPYNSSSAATITAYPVTIGAELQTQTQVGSMYDIAGPNCPLYGIKNGVSRKNAPKFKMSHMFAVIALNIVNKGDGGDIVIRSAGITATEEIVGAFNVNILGNPAQGKYDPIFTKTDAKKQTTVDLTSAAVVKYNESATLYFAVKPFDASNKDLKISVNGITRTVQMPAGTRFDAGTITKLSVDVTPLTHPTDNDALNMTSGGKKVFDMSKATSKTMTVNGKNVTGYILGEGSQESITVTGTVKDLMNALDVGFYASSWKGQRIAMTVNHLNLWIEGTQFANYQPFLNAIKADLGIGNSIGDKIKWAAMEAGVKLLFSSGVDRTGTLMGLTDFMDPSTITFVGVVENGTPAPASGETPNIVLINENEINKEVSSAAVEHLLKTKFDYKQADGTILLPTFEGLSDIINGNPNSTKANETANAIYNKLQAAIGNKSFSASGIGTLHVWKIFQGIFSSAEDMKAKLPNLKVSVDIATIPYSAEKGAYGTKGNPKTPSGAYNPIVIWGLDVTTAEEKQQMGN